MKLTIKTPNLTVIIDEVKTTSSVYGESKLIKELITEAVKESINLKNNN